MTRLDDTNMIQSGNNSTVDTEKRLTSLLELKIRLVGEGGACDSPVLGSYLSEMNNRSWWSIFDKNRRAHQLRNHQVSSIVNSINAVIQADSYQKTEEQFRTFGEDLKWDDCSGNETLKRINLTHNLIKKTMDHIQDSYGLRLKNRSELYALLKEAYDEDVSNTQGQSYYESFK